MRALGRYERETMETYHMNQPVASRPPFPPARLYFELHVTVDSEGSSEVDFEAFKRMMTLIGWKASRFDQDDVDDYHGKWFASQRCTTDASIREELSAVLFVCSTCYWPVLRWKAEDTLLDSKHGDTL